MDVASTPCQRLPTLMEHRLHRNHPRFMLLKALHVGLQSQAAGLMSTWRSLHVL